MEIRIGLKVHACVYGFKYAHLECWHYLQKKTCKTKNNNNNRLLISLTFIAFTPDVISKGVAYDRKNVHKLSESSSTAELRLGWMSILF